MLFRSLLGKDPQPERVAVLAVGQVLLELVAVPSGVDHVAEALPPRRLQRRREREVVAWAAGKAGVEAALGRLAQVRAAVFLVFWSRWV